jgi:uncharacterized protein
LESDPLEHAFADACLDVSVDGMASNLRAFLETRNVPAEDVDAILAAPPRLDVYRILVRNTISSIVARVLPRTRARLNDACCGMFDADLAVFLQEVGPRTHYLKDVPDEFFVWSEPRWRARAGVPAYLPDLAGHEIACFAIASVLSDAPWPTTAVENVDPALDPQRGLVFSPSTRLATYSWSVHTLSEDVGVRNVPSAGRVHLLGYRDEGHSVRWLELTPLAARVVRRLMDGEPLAVAVDRACEELEATAAVSDLAHLLADLAAREVLLGSGNARR